MANLERCLASVSPHIACWIIGDTGSTDGTQAFVRKFFAERDIPGELHEFPFVDFGQARNEALTRARASPLAFDYLLLTDADMELSVGDPDFAQNLTAAACKVLQRAGIAYWNIRLVRRDAPAAYKGVTHEFLDVGKGAVLDLKSIEFIDHATGSNRVEKYDRDSRLLKAAIAAETDPFMRSRYTFYLANTYRDAGRKPEALETYLERARLGHWQEEVFESLLNAANLKAQLGLPDDEVIAAFTEAAASRPSRAEALHAAARFCRTKGLHDRAYDFASRGLAIAYPQDGLFVQDWTYDYGLLDELAIAAYWTERYDQCAEACDRLLAEGKLPADERERVEGNRRYAVAKLDEAAALSSADDGGYLRLLRAARAKEEIRKPDPEVLAAYAEAAAACPSRVEALHGAARFCRNRSLYDQGYDFAARGLAIPRPAEAPLVEDWIYDYGILDEFAINAYWTARYADCIEACDRLLAGGELPAHERERVERNKAFALEKQQEIEKLAAAGDTPFVKLLHEARRKEELGRPPEEVIAAYEAASAADPTRAEALHGAAHYCRTRGVHRPAWEYALRGLALPKPEGAPNLEDWIYDWGLTQELSIAANYAEDPAIKDRGFAACNWLALNRTIPEAPRNIALSNLEFYVVTAAQMTPSFRTRRVEFSPPEGYQTTNPSITRFGEELALVQRTVNYTVEHPTNDDEWDIWKTQDDVPYHTRNFLLRLDGDLEIRSSAEILPPEDMPEPASRDCLGFEDLRPFEWRGGLWCVSNLRELSPDGLSEMVLARIDERAPQEARLADWRVLRPDGPRRHEKNWMPWAEGDKLRLVYTCGPTRIVDEQADTVAETVPPVQAELFRGGSQLVAFDGGWLALVHEARERDRRRLYRHRWVQFDDHGRLERVSPPFVFHQLGIEFAAGLAWTSGDRLAATYGVEDREAWIATVEAADVRRVLEDAHAVRSGAPARTEARAARAGPAPERGLRRPLRQARPGVAAAPASATSVEPRRPALTSAPEVFLDHAPFLRAANSPAERREQSRPFDARIAALLEPTAPQALPQIHCFYEVLSGGARHQALIAAVTSMHAAGHSVNVWTYSPENLEFLEPLGVELRSAADIVPRGLFQHVMARAEIRYFSDIFRYAVLYEQGGLWMDTDIVLLRPFPFRGDHFFNLQWRSGARNEHFVCGNVIYARPHSLHMRALYERSIELVFGPQDWAFGEVGPKLLSDYIASEAGAELLDSVFSPIFFNSIDWTEIDRFDRPLSELADHLNDERVFGAHLWSGSNKPDGRPADSLIAELSDPLTAYPSLSELADRFDTDRNRRTGNSHFYARIYERLLGDRRLSLRRLLEIGLSRDGVERVETEPPSITLWQTYFPFAEIVGLDPADASALNTPRFRSFICDQSKVEDLRAVAAQLEPGSFDVIIDDGSHASFDEQLTLRELFPLLSDGGWFFIESLDWQPPGEDRDEIALTKDLLREIQQHGVARSIDPMGVSALAGQFEEILFFDSHYELGRARLMGGLVAIKKRGGSGLVR